MYRKKDIQGPTYTLEVHSKLPFLKDRQYSIINMLTVEPLGPDRCRQSLKGDVDIRVFGIGSVVQGIVLNSLSSAYKVLPEIVEKYAGDGWACMLPTNPHHIQNHKTTPQMESGARRPGCGGPPAQTGSPTLNQTLTSFAIAL